MNKNVTATAVRMLPFFCRNEIPFFNALFNNMRTLKFKGRPTNAFFAAVNQIEVRRVLQASHYCRALFRCLTCAQRIHYPALGSSRKLGGAAEHLIDGSEKRICRLSFEF